MKLARPAAAFAVFAFLAFVVCQAQTTMKQQLPDPRTGKAVEFVIVISADGSTFTASVFGESATFPTSDFSKGGDSAYIVWLTRLLAGRQAPGDGERAGPPAPEERGGGADAPPGTTAPPSRASRQAYAFVWQNSKGFWFADGPVQLLSFGEKSREEALSYVMGKGRRAVKDIPYYYKGVYGGGTLILLSDPPLESYERDIAGIYNYIP